MASKNNLRAVLKDTADALREKSGTSSPIVPRDFATFISSMPSGGSDMASFLDGTVTSVSASNSMEKVRNASCANLDDLESIQLGVVSGPIEDLAFYGDFNVSSFSINPDSNITSLGCNCFTGLGMNAEDHERFFFDFRNSTFTNFQGFAIRAIKDDSLDEITALGIFISNAEIRLPVTVSSIGSTSYTSKLTLGSSGSGGVLDGCTNIDLFLSGSNIIPLIETALLPTDSESRIFVPYETYGVYSIQTNWSSLDNLYGYKVYPLGENLPLIDLEGYELEWFADKAFTEQISVGNGNEVYCRQTGTRLYTKVEATLVDGSLSIVDSHSHSYSVGELIPIGETVTITPSYSGQEPKPAEYFFKVGDSTYSTEDSVTVSASILDIFVVLAYGVEVLPSYLDVVQFSSVIERNSYFLWLKDKHLYTVTDEDKAKYIVCSISGSSERISSDITSFTARTQYIYNDTLVSIVAWAANFDSFLYDEMGVYNVTSIDFENGYKYITRAIAQGDSASGNTISLPTTIQSVALPNSLIYFEGFHVYTESNLISLDIPASVLIAKNLCIAYSSNSSITFHDRQDNHPVCVKNIDVVRGSSALPTYHHIALNLSKNVMFIPFDDYLSYDEESNDFSYRYQSYCDYTNGLSNLVLYDAPVDISFASSPLFVSYVNNTLYLCNDEILYCHIPTALPIDFIIPESVNCICGKAFTKCNANSINLENDNIQLISEYAICEPRRLNRLTLPEAYYVYPFSVFRWTESVSDDSVLPEFISLPVITFYGGSTPCYELRLSTVSSQSHTYTLYLRKFNGPHSEGETYNMTTYVNTFIDGRSSTLSSIVLDDNIFVQNWEGLTDNLVNLTSITFHGTISRWQELSYHIPPSVTVVHCSDGDITINS